jgi:hypothetical protein
VSTLDESTQRGYETLQPTLSAAIETLGQAQRITFFQYKKAILPLDGYVFWVKTGAELVIDGILHYASERREEEDQTVAVNDVSFTTKSQVLEFNAVAPQFLYIAIYQPPRQPAAPPSPPIRFAFVARQPIQRMAGLFHYRGHAVFASLATQLLDDISQIDTTKLIVSNSLPAWLSLASYSPEWLIPTNPQIPLYPSYLLPDNLEPPYGAVHIHPDSIRSLQSAPWLNRTGSRYQLTSERVRVILYGCNNDIASDFLDVVEQYSIDTNTIGMMSMMPAIHDDKVFQPEMVVLAQKKSFDFEISYLQTRMRLAARQLIYNAFTTVTPGIPGLLTDFVPASAGVNVVLGTSQA